MLGHFQRLRPGLGGTFRMQWPPRQRPLLPPYARVWLIRALAAEQHEDWIEQHRCRHQPRILISRGEDSQAPELDRVSPGFPRRLALGRQPVAKALIAQRHPDCARLMRLTDQWTSSAKGVFDCNGPGVACSTFAGLPWLLHFREQCGDRVCFWPFDGWDPPRDRHVVAEPYPSIFRRRYLDSGLRGDALDAYAVARWLGEMDGLGFLERYFRPPLTAEQQERAQMEGWILGVA